MDVDLDSLQMDTPMPDLELNLDSALGTLAVDDTTLITLTARNYQLQLLNQAKSCNTIVVLETGSGKTLIAGLLIKVLHHTFYRNLTPFPLF